MNTSVKLMEFPNVFHTRSSAMVNALVAMLNVELINAQELMVPMARQTTGATPARKLMEIKFVCPRI